MVIAIQLLNGKLDNSGVYLRDFADLVQTHLKLQILVPQNVRHVVSPNIREAPLKQPVPEGKHTSWLEMA